MGWTSYHATNYKKNGEIDRKAECDGYFDNTKYIILKSVMVGSVYYAAAKSSVGENQVFAVVFLTSVDRNDYFNFSYKAMTEHEGPCEARCPESILKLLTPTDDTYANNWRQRCYENVDKKRNPKALPNLPVGAVIQFTVNDEKVTLVKHSPAYQFKKPFWYCEKFNMYYSQKHIPNNYEVVKGA